MVVIYGPLCQRIPSVGLILWIDENKFVTDLLEKVFKKKNISFYSLNNAKDFLYIVSDLRPSMIVIDSETALKHKTELKLQLDQSDLLRSLPWVILGESSELSFLPNRSGEIKRPFDPFLIPELIEKIVKSH